MSTHSLCERRRAPRASFQRPIMLRTGGGAVLQATCSDVSELGMSLRTPGSPVDDDGKPLWLTFSLPRVPHMIQLKAQVVRRQQDTLGVQFVEMPPAVRRMLRTYVFTGRGWIKNYEPPTPPPRVV